MPVVAELPENHTPHNNRVWDYHMVELIKNERVLYGNLCNLFAVLMSLCDSVTKNKVERKNEYYLEDELDSMGLLSISKKLVYTDGTNALYTRHNKAMPHMHLMNLHQDRFQDIQDFRDSYIAIQKVLVELKLGFGRCKRDVKAILKEKVSRAQPSVDLKRQLTK